jgi:hypothetical protein
MIDAKVVAQAILEEWRIWVDSVVYGTPEETAKLSSEQKAAHWAPVPNLDALATVVEEMFWASLLTEEGRPCRPRLVYMTKPREEAAPNDALFHHHFADPRPVTRADLRRLSQIQGGEGYVEWRDPIGSPVITGLFVPNELPLSTSGRSLPGLALAATAPGVLNVDHLSERMVVLRAGLLYRRSTCAILPLDQALRPVATVLGSQTPGFFHRTIREITRHGHGGSVWMCRADDPLAGLRIGYPVLPVDDLLGKPNRFEWLRSLGHLAAIDGAVTVDTAGHLRGFGAFVDLGEPFPVQLVRPDGREQITSDALGGGRHRSGAAFCRRFAPAAAVVVSQDGKVTVMVANSAEVAAWDVSPLGHGFRAND